MLSFITSIFCGSFAAATFLLIWRRLPASWLFDTTDTSPHPLARDTSLFSRGFGSLLFLVTLFLHFHEKTAYTGVLGVLARSWILVLLWLLAQIALADLFYRLIPDQWSLAIFCLGLLRLCYLTWMHWIAASLSLGTAVTAACLPQWLPLLFCALTAFLLYVFPRRLLDRPALGLGDVKLFFVLAVALKPALFFPSMIRAALLGGVSALFMMATKRSDRGVPYGTVLALAVLWTWIFS